MDLAWNFITSAGVTTRTAVTPTTAGVYDWTHIGDGIYKLEIPASGGGSINNDTEGYGWFTGICTGVLHWGSPVYGFRDAALNDVLVDSAHSATRGLAGTALPDAVADAAGGLAISDTGGLDMDALAADAARLTAARAQVLTDWIDGGRLDLLLDAIPTTAMRGTDGANTTTPNTVVPDAAGVVTALLPSALVNGRMDSNTSAINNDNPAAVLQAQALGCMIFGTVESGTLSTTEMTTDLTISIANQLNGRTIVFLGNTTTTGLRRQGATITATAVSGGKLTFAALTNVPAVGDTFVIF